MTNTLTFSYSANKITVTRAGDADKVDAINAALPTIYSVQHQAAGRTRASRGGGVPAATATCGTRRPGSTTRTCTSSRTTSRRCSASTSSRPASSTAATRRTRSQQHVLQEAVQLNGSAGYMTRGGYRTGSTPATRSRTCCWPERSSTRTRSSTNPNVQQRWHDIEFYVADSYKVAPRVTVDFGVRFSHMQPPFMADDQLGNFVPSSVNPALGNAPCNGMHYPPGTNPCPALGSRRHRRAEPVAHPDQVPLDRPPPRRRLGRLRQRQDGDPRRLRSLLPARAGERRPGRRHDAALLGNLQRRPDARLRSVVTGDAAPAFGAAPTRSSRKRRTPTPGSGTSPSSSESSEHGARGRVRRQQGPRPLRTDEPERGRPREPSRLLARATRLSGR